MITIPFPRFVSEDDEAQPSAGFLRALAQSLSDEELLTFQTEDEDVKEWLRRAHAARVAG